ncbi:hypothetical protein WA577_002598 [Blastocystis sp. JDR]
MLGTRIYRKDKMRKIALIAFICVAVYALLFRPSKTVKDLDTKAKAEEEEGRRSIVEESELDERAAEGMDARELHMIYTRSNELIWIVDARSEEEFDRMHISGAHSLNEFRTKLLKDVPNIRIFFYSNDSTRSRVIANQYASVGRQVYYVVGGLNVWKDIEGLKLVEGSEVA